MGRLYLALLFHSQDVVDALVNYSGSLVPFVLEWQASRCDTGLTLDDEQDCWLQVVGSKVRGEVG